MIVFLIFVLPSSKAGQLPLSELNAIVDQTNFIVGGGCSGTLISLSPALILTNHHCIDRFVRTVNTQRESKNGTMEQVTELRLDPVNVSQVLYRRHETVGNQMYVSEIVARQRNRDLAVLQLRAETIPHARVSTLLPAEVAILRGEPVWAVGNPAGLDATITQGIISSVNRTFRFTWAENEDLPMIQTDVGLFGGNSGGALYNQYGYLIGVPTAGIRQASHLGLAIPHNVVWEMLENHCLAVQVGGTNNDYCNDED